MWLKLLWIRERHVTPTKPPHPDIVSVFSACFGNGLGRNGNESGAL